MDSYLNDEKLQEIITAKAITNQSYPKFTYNQGLLR